MSSQREKDSNAVEPGSVDELTRVMALHLRYSGAPQGALVHDLSKLGFRPGRIAELLGTTPNTVSQQKRDNRPVWPVERKVG